MTLENLRESIISTADLIHPNLQCLKNKYVSFEDMIDFILYEGIKSAYDDFTEKKSIRQHLIDNNMDTDADRRRLSRKFLYAQYYRDLQNQNLAEDGLWSDELEGKNMDDFSKRMEGHEVTSMNFQELCNMLDMPVLEKIISRKIGSSKKVSNSMFVEIMRQYENFVNALHDAMDTPEQIVYNTEMFFTLEWKYNIGLVYEIVLEAEKCGYPEFDPYSIRGILGGIYVPPTTEWFHDNIFTEARMIYKRPDLVPLVFEGETIERLQFDIINAELYRLREAIYRTTHKHGLAELISQTSMEDRAAFIQNRQWIWEKYNRQKEWTSDRIKYARKVFDNIYRVHEPPKIK